MKIQHPLKNLVALIENTKSSVNGITFITETDKEDYISYNDLYSKSLTILYDLQKKGLNPKDELIFQIETKKDFVLLFWACILGNIVPIPISPAIKDPLRAKLRSIWNKLDSPYLAISKKNLVSFQNYLKESGFDKTLSEIEENVIDYKELGNHNFAGKIIIPDEDDIAFVQFSSGSTSDPKGVKLTHKNLITNIYDIAEGMRLEEKENFLSWMPLTHDMGLIGTHLTIMLRKINQFHMETDLFIRNPSIWLRKISEHRIAISASPNFGFKIVTRFFRSHSYENIDLSCLRLIFNGAEPIFPEVCQDFLTKFEPYGLRKNSMFPVYGLAEASLAVSFSDPDSEIVIVDLDKNHCNLYEQIVEDHSSEISISLVEVGKPLKNCEVKIVDCDGISLPDRTIGQILIKGDNITKGYYNNDAATQDIIDRQGWLNTGDLGFFRNGNLVITGRMKDVVYINGNSFFTHELENIASELDSIDFSRIVFCGTYNYNLKSEEIICFILYRNKIEHLLSLITQLRIHLLNRIGVEISKVIPVKQIPFTTSGKKQRYTLKTQYENGYFTDILAQIASSLENKATV